MKIEVGKSYFRRDHLGPVAILEKIANDRFRSDMGADGKYYHRSEARGNGAVYREDGSWLHCNDFKNGHSKDLVSEHKLHEMGVDDCIQVNSNNQREV